MKRITKRDVYMLSSLLIVCTLIFSMAAIAQVPITDVVEQPIITLSDDLGGSRATHHTVLAEVGTATWCPHCPSMSTYIAQVSGDFMYINLVADMNGAAESRRQQLGITGYPTAVFDGGYTQVVGGQTSVTNLQNAYNTCQARIVADVFPSVSAVYDETDDTMDITVFIDNTGSSTFNGRLRVYVVEKTSRWLQYGGNAPYSNALIGLPVQKPFTVGAGQSITETINDWTFPDISMDNLLVIATVFDQSTEYAEQTTVVNPTTGGGNGGGGPIGPPPVVKITYPSHNAFVNGTVNIEGTAHHPAGTIKWVMLQIDGGSWMKAKGTSSWSYEWDTTEVFDGEYQILAISSDGNLQSSVDVISVNVKNNETEDPEEEELFSSLNCAGVLQWTMVSPGDTIEGEIFISNQGDIGSVLSWEIQSFPDWGEWYASPNSGEDLGVEDGYVNVTILVTAPDEKETEFTGSLTIVNRDNESDVCTIPITLVTPIRPSSWFMRLLDLLQARFPLLGTFW